jgi:hypothetical protein
VAGAVAHSKPVVSFGSGVDTITVRHITSSTAPATARTNLTGHSPDQSKE